jgi:hypothetical protein
MLDSLAPVGHLEKLLTHRLATLSWRMSRLARYESEMVKASMATTKSDIEADSELGSRRPPDLWDGLGAENLRAKLVRTFLDILPGLLPEQPIRKEFARLMVWKLWEELSSHAQRSVVPIPGVPEDDDGFEAFDKWTAGLLRNVLELYAAAGGIGNRSSSERPAVERCSNQT